MLAYGVSCADCSNRPATVNGLMMKRDTRMMMMRRVSMNKNGKSFDSLSLTNHDDDADKSSLPISSLKKAAAAAESNSNSFDFLGANKFGNKFLIDGNQQSVPIESLRGKILALYFEKALPKPLCDKRIGLPDYYIDFYNSLKPEAAAAFEMIYVVPSVYDQSFFDAAMSKLPCLAVPFNDHHWRSHLFRKYDNKDVLRYSGMFLIDTSDNKIRVLTDHGYNYIYPYGPLSFPFTPARIQQLKSQCQQMGRETSLSAILGSDSRDYLLDPHYNKVPISSLRDKHVLIYGMQIEYLEFEFQIQLQEIYRRFRNQGVEIVSFNLEHNNGDGEYETLWEDHLAQIPWLHLPAGDEKIWLLRTMMFKENTCIVEAPMLFVKPKGESLLDPYGHQIFKLFGFKAFPFTREAAGLSVLTRLKGVSFKSFVDKAGQFGFDFKSLNRNKADGGTELVSLSNILEGRGILLLFGNLWNGLGEVLDSLIEVYLNQNESSSSSYFEVIFVSTDGNTQSFMHHFSIMPWFAFQRPLEQWECNELGKITTHVNFGDHGHFLAFGPDQLLVQVGKLSKSFENGVFPFVNDDESTVYLDKLTTRMCTW